ncbi:uncharacterized protein LOC143218975 [Lasioglossum baleicum]|uniref:uncharacterized protein LOC143218975 n=1 Tax=Lasioglossum baleicum TaxID=434251 RepID=UPI003FCE7BEF
MHIFVRAVQFQQHITKQRVLYLGKGVFADEPGTRLKNLLRRGMGKVSSENSDSKIRCYRQVFNDRVKVSTIGLQEVCAWERENFRVRKFLLSHARSPLHLYLYLFLTKTSTNWFSTNRSALALSPIERDLRSALIRSLNRVINIYTCEL